MGALEAVLQLKAQEQQREQFKSQQLTQAAELFQRAKQQASEDKFRSLALAQKEREMASDNVIKNIIRGQSMEQAGLNMQKDAYDLEDDEGYARGAQMRKMGQNIATAAITPPDQKVNTYLDPMTARMMPEVPLEPLEQGTTNEGKNLGQIKQEKEKRKQKQELEAKKSEQEQTIALEDTKPLSSEGATRYAGAKQGIDNINNIIGQINTFSGDRRDLIRQANLAIEAENAKDTILPMAKGIYRGSKLMRVSNEGKALANNFSTLAENLLRARTGATAPDPEIVRENARTLLKTFQESPETWNQRLKNDYDFLKTTHDEIRPRRKNDAVLKGEIYKEYNSAAEAEKDNPPVGSIIIIKGKKMRVDE